MIDQPKGVVLKVRGVMYGGWKRVRITRGIETISGSFDLEVSDRWSDSEAAQPIRQGDECSVEIHGTPVITGYVDQRSISYGATEHTISVSGRDRTGSLVDCSAGADGAATGPFEFRSSTLLSVIKKVCEASGVRATLQPGVVLPKPPAKISIDPGDTAFEVIERCCRLAALLPVSDGVGGLLLTRAGSTRCTDALIEGQNILSGSSKFSAKERFFTYAVFGSHAGTDWLSGKSAASIKAFAEDQNVRRVARTLLIRPEGNATTEHAKKRAEWEASVRAARADVVTITVQGWQQSTGALWPVNALVSVESPMLELRSQMLITQATYSLDDSGEVTELQVRPPDAFSPEPTIKPPPKARPWKEVEGGV